MIFLMNFVNEAWKCTCFPRIGLQIINKGNQLCWWMSLRWGILSCNFETLTKLRICRNKSGNEIYTLRLMKGMKLFSVSYIIMSPYQRSVSTAMITKTKDQVWRVHLRYRHFFSAKLKRQSVFQRQRDINSSNVSVHLWNNCTL